MFDVPIYPSTVNVRWMERKQQQKKTEKEEKYRLQLHEKKLTKLN